MAPLREALGSLTVGRDHPEVERGAGDHVEDQELKMVRNKLVVFTLYSPFRIKLDVSRCQFNKMMNYSTMITKTHLLFCFYCDLLWLLIPKQYSPIMF